MRDFWDMANHPAAAFRKQNRYLAWGFVAATILVVTIVKPLLGLWVNGFEAAIWSGRTIVLLLSGALSYVAISAGFFLICRAFGSTTPLNVFLKSWGLTYLPTFLCAVVVSLAETYFYLFWGNLLLGLILNLVFGGILIWKTILYAVFLRNVADLRGKFFWKAFLACGALVLVLAFFNLAIGLETPIL